MSIICTRVNISPKILSRFWLIPFFLVFLGGCKHNNQKKNNSENVAHLLQRSSFLVDSLGNEEAVRFMDSAFSKISLSGYEKYQIYFIKYNYYRNQARNFHKSLKYADSMLLSVNRCESFDTSDIFTAYVTKGDAHYILEEYDNAFYYYHKAQQIASNYSSVCLKSMFLSRIAMANYKEERYLFAARLFKTSYELNINCAADTIDNTRNFEIEYKTQENISNTGLSYEKICKYDSSLYFYKQAVSYISSRKNKYKSKQREWNVAEAVVYGNIGSLYSKMKLYDSAEFYLTKSVAQNKGVNYNMLDKMYNQLKLADVYIAVSRYQDAYSILKDEEDEGSKPNLFKINYEDSLEWMDRRNDVLSKYFFETGDYKNAAKCYQLHHQTQVAKWKGTEKNVLNGLEHGINKISNQQYIGGLENDMKIKRQQATILILVSIIAVGIVSFIFYLLKRYQRKYKKLSVNTERIISDSSHKEEELKAKIKKDKANYLALLENTDDLLWSVDLDFNLLAFNHSYYQHIQKITGRQPEVGLSTFNKDVDPEFFNRMQGYYEKVIVFGAFSVVDKGICYDGYSPDIELKFKPIYDENRMPVGVSCSRKDITEYVSMIETLDKNNNQLRSIAWVQSHNLRGPLSTIMGISNLLLEDEDLDKGTKHEMLVGLNEKTGEMDKIIHEIIDLTNN
jgi:PAS domain S-box-containing protein